MGVTSMYRKGPLIALVISILVLTGCSNGRPSSNDIDDQATISLEHVLTPHELIVYKPEANKIALEMKRISIKMIEEYNNGKDLSEEQMKEFEKLRDNYRTKGFEFVEQHFSIDNPKVINHIFDKIKASKAVRSEYLNDKGLEESNYYLVHVEYGDERNFRLEDGYMLSFRIFEDNTLVIVTLAEESIRNTIEIKTEFDYEVFENIINEGKHRNR